MMLDLFIQLAALRVLAALAWACAALACALSFVEHYRWRAGALHSAFAFDVYRAMTLGSAWNGIIAITAICYPPLGRVPLINGTFGMATTTALMFEGFGLTVLVFLVLRGSEVLGLHRWQKPR